jgi:hypothetical protein
MTGRHSHWKGISTELVQTGNSIASYFAGIVQPMSNGPPILEGTANRGQAGPFKELTYHGKRNLQTNGRGRAGQLGQE